jgi:Xaa-Pro aminopeptidase
VRPAATAPAFSERLRKVRAALPAADVDALLVTHLPNIRYLVGFDGTLGALYLSASDCVLIVDGRYITGVTTRIAEDEELAGVRVQLVDRSLEEAIAQTVMASSARGLGVEGAAISLERFDRLSEMLGRLEAESGKAGPRVRSTQRVVEAVRLIKDAAEIATLREAAVRLSRVARGVLGDAVQPGRTERDVAADIDDALRRGGFERPAFDTIVASGPNGALPHARPGLRRLQPGDGVVLDFGGVYDGYCVDLTRTVQLEPADSAFDALFDAVRAAQAAAIAAVRPGVKASDVDKAARDVLASRGLGSAFVHGTGHGLGLEIHEAPRIGKAATVELDETLAAGMVFTIEPGAYVPGVGGVRIEDDVLVVADGCELLTDVPIDG